MVKLNLLREISICNIVSREYSVYQMRHFLIGFIFEFFGQLKPFANSSKLESELITLKRSSFMTIDNSHQSFLHTNSLKRHQNIRLT